MPTKSAAKSTAVNSTRTKPRKTSISFPPVNPIINTGKLPSTSVQRRIHRVLGNDADFAIHLVAFGFQSASARFNLTNKALTAKMNSVVRKLSQDPESSAVQRAEWKKYVVSA